MGLESKINDAIKNAMKAKDKVSLRGLRAIKQAILLQKTDGSGKELEASDEIKMLQKLVKQRKESLDIFQKQERSDLAQVEAEEIAVIETFLPEQMTTEELKSAVEAIVQKTGATSMRDMGRVMGAANTELGGKADGKAIAAIVKELLG